MVLSDYEDALSSYIHDDDKLVTYKWLSKEFEIHVNVAKQILKEYWEKNKDKEKIVATFLIIGQLNDRSIRVEVVKESNLNTAKEKFVKIDCEHLYSLQKSLPNIELLAYAGEGDLRYSAIKCNEDYVRNNEEVEGLRYVGNIAKEKNISIDSNVEGRNVPKKVSPAKDKSKNVDNKEDIEKKEKTAEKGKRKIIEKEKEKLTESKVETKSGAPEKKTSPTQSNSNSKVSSKLTKKPVQSKQTGFNNLFGKSSSKPQVTKPKEESSDISNKKEKKEDTKSSGKDNKKKEQEKEKKENEKSQEKENKTQQSIGKSKSISKSNTEVDIKSSSKKENRGKKRNRSREKTSSQKRKRIVVVDSSDDEVNKSDEEENEEVEEPMEVEEVPPPVVKKRSPSPPPEKRENGKRMVRKTIDKTFKDEDGYLVTKRVHVYEAASDNDEPSEMKVEEPAKPKPAEIKAKKKQTTLMNFFKKS